MFVVTAVVVSELAARSRRRANESALLAEIAASLLEHGDLAPELDRIAAEAAQALQVGQATITVGDAAPTAEGERQPLFADGRRVGTIVLKGPRQSGAAARRRLLPALASLLGVAIDRERLANEALEAETLRRSDAVKTAVLRSVSHDLRSPLMAILTSASALARSDLELDAGRPARAASRPSSTRPTGSTASSATCSTSRGWRPARREPRPEVWPVDELVAQAIGQLGDAGGRIEVELPDESPAVRVDAQQIERVLVNLFENALKYSPEPEPVRVQLAEAADRVLVRVVDHGPGVSPDDRRAHLRAVPARRRRRARRRARARDRPRLRRGERRARLGESRPGQGATFVLALPGGG